MLIGSLIVIAKSLHDRLVFVFGFNVPRCFDHVRHSFVYCLLFTRFRLRPEKLSRIGYEKL